MTYGKLYHDVTWFADSAGAGSYRAYTRNLFHHHGDCFITLYSQVPQNLAVSHPATLMAGATSFPVTANDSSVIALTVDGEIIGCAMGTGSVVNITIPPQTPGKTMIVTVTRFNYRRYTASVPVVSSNYPYVTMGRQIINDSGGNGQVNPGETVNYGVYGKNVGQGTAQQVRGKLSETSPYVTVSIDSSWYGNIAQNDSVLGNPYYRFVVANNCPNGHQINFTLRFRDVNDSNFYSYPVLTVYAPVLVYQSYQVTGGNGNGILDPGETANLVVTIKNEGGATASNIAGVLMENSPYITINDANGNFGTLNPGATGSNSSDVFTVAAAGNTPNGTVVNFQVQLTSGVYCDTVDFSLVVGRKQYYIWNPDPTPTPGQNMHTILGSLGYSGDYGTTLASDLSLYQVLFVCVGVYPNNYIIGASSAEATRIVNYLQNQAGRVYLEGGDVWYYDPLYQGGYNFNSLFGINATSDGSGDMGPVQGQAGTFTAGMLFNYGGENSYMDRISASGSGAFLIFRDQNNSYDCGVARSVTGSYKTVGTSFELGLLTDGSGVSTRAVLLDSIMHFFGCYVVGVEEDNELGLEPGKVGMVLAPNPFNGKLQIRYTIQDGGKMIQDTRYTIQDINLKIFDVGGRVVKSFNLESCIMNHESAIFWDGKDDSGRRLPAGVYFVRLEAGDYRQIEKAILLR
jgi:hypothetical protein